MNFVDYTDQYYSKCLALFDLNCPEFFAPNERADYSDYLKTNNDSYQLAFTEEGIIAAAFGISINNDRARITWIMTNPNIQGQGVGSQMMKSAINFAANKNIKLIDISASHLSAPFFAKFGAEELKFTENGWGKDMHRVDMAILLTK